MNPYEITRRRNSRGRLVNTGQRAPDATDSIVISVEYYQEYYLVKLPDRTYILTQFSDIYRDRLTADGSVTLPIGVKKTTSSAAREYLASICDEYEAGNIFSLYMIDDTWQKSYENTFFIIKLVISIVVFFLLAIIMLLIFFKVQKEQ